MLVFPKYPLKLFALNLFLDVPAPLTYAINNESFLKNINRGTKWIEILLRTKYNFQTNFYIKELMYIALKIVHSR